MAKIIDFRVTPPFNEYSTMEEGRRVFLEGYMSPYGDTYGEDMNVLKTDMPKLLKDMEEAKVDFAVMQGEWILGDMKAMNDAVYRIARQHPDKFPFYFLGVETNSNEFLPRYIEENVKERGFAGVNIQSWPTQQPMLSPCWMPVYAKCQELGIPITIHTSINFTLDRPIRLGRPIYISDIASMFPDLTIVANHGGWPWVNEMVAVAWKHKNVYVEIGAQSPKYLAKAGTGWESLMTFGNSVIQDKVLFATDVMLSPQRVIAELYETPLKDSVKEKWLGLNAERLLDRIKRYQ